MGGFFYYIHRMNSNNPIYPCLWFNHQAREAAECYVSIFENSRILSDNGMVVMFELRETKFMALNGGPEFQFNESISMVINCENQQEVDHFWDALVSDGGQESQCGWLKDRFGVSWQVVPSELGNWIGNPDSEVRDYAIAALMKMKKIIIEDLKRIH